MFIPEWYGSTWGQQNDSYRSVRFLEEDDSRVINWDCEGLNKDSPSTGCKRSLSFPRNSHKDLRDVCLHNKTKTQKSIQVSNSYINYGSCINEFCTLFSYIFRHMDSYRIVLLSCVLFSTVNTYFLSKLLDEFRSQLKYKNFYTQYGIEWSNE